MVGCVGTPTATPNIEATITARVQETLAAQTPTPYPTHTPVVIVKEVMLEVPVEVVKEIIVEKIVVVTATPTAPPTPTATPTPTVTVVPTRLSFPTLCGNTSTQVRSPLTIANGHGFELEVTSPDLIFERMVFVTHPGDGSNRLFLVLQSGCILVISNEERDSFPKVFLDIRDRVNRSGNEQGLLGLAFDPNYANTGYFYVYYSATGVSRSVVSRFTVSSDDGNFAHENSEEVILEVDQPFSNHNGGSILFGPDGYLYIGLGDGGAGGDPGGRSQNTEILLGSILRIDPSSASSTNNYTIPEDNPYIGVRGFREEIWAYGFRNPWRFSFDAETGNLWVGDVGQSRWEEINIVKKGLNYGWNIMEGSQCFRPTVGCSKIGLEFPIVEYANPESGCSVTGGYVYRGSLLPDLYGFYIYGDFCSGNIWALHYNGQEVTDHFLVVDSNLQISSFGEDQEGELYILSFNGRIYHLKRQGL